MPVDLTRYESISEHLKVIECNICNKYWEKAIIWMGIKVEFKPLSLKKGGTMKRGNTYGIIQYKDALTDDIFTKPVYYTREEAIKEIMKPTELREAMRDMKRIDTCSFCGKSGCGNAELKMWGRLDIPYKYIRAYECMGKRYEVEDINHKRFKICRNCLIDKFGLKE